MQLPARLPTCCSLSAPPSTLPPQPILSQLVASPPAQEDPPHLGVPSPPGEQAAPWVPEEEKATTPPELLGPQPSRGLTGANPGQKLAGSWSQGQRICIIPENKLWAAGTRAGCRRAGYLGLLHCGAGHPALGCAGGWGHRTPHPSQPFSLHLRWTQSSCFQTRGVCPAGHRNILLLWRQVTALRAHLAELREATERWAPGGSSGRGGAAGGGLALPSGSSWCSVLAHEPHTALSGPGVGPVGVVGRWEGWAVGEGKKTQQRSRGAKGR